MSSGYSGRGERENRLIFYGRRNVEKVEKIIGLVYGGVLSNNSEDIRIS